MTRGPHISSAQAAPLRGESIRGPAPTGSPPLQPSAQPLHGAGDAPGDGLQFRGNELLTPREREVLKAIIGGSSNKEIGRILRVSPRTIEVHRARIMTKLGAKNTADLVRIVLSQDGESSPD